MGCHHHVPLAAPQHLAFEALLFPPCTNPRAVKLFFSLSVFPRIADSSGAQGWLWAALTLRRLPEGNKCVLLVFPFEEMMKSCLCSEPWLTPTFL